MEQPPTPYIWQYQPQTGFTSGARQDYGAVINWLQSDGRMFSRIRDVNLARNAIDKGRALVTRSSITTNINRWPSEEVEQYDGTPFVPPQPEHLQTTSDFVRTAEGQQLAGAGFTGPPYSLTDGRQYRKLTRDAMPFPHNYQVFENGSWHRVEDLSGGAANALTSYPTLQYAAVPPILKYSRLGQQLQGGSIPFRPTQLALLTEESRVARSGGINPYQFMKEFPPVVYEHPFDGNEAYFPKEFSPLFDPSKAFLRTTDQTLQYVPHS